MTQSILLRRIKLENIFRPKDSAIMDQMLPSPSFNIPSIGTPHHAMEEDQMIAPSAQEAQQTARQQSNLYSYGGFTPQTASQTPSGLLSQTPHNLLGSSSSHHGTPQTLLGTGGRQPDTPGLGGGGGAPVYAPVASPAPASPAIQHTDIIPQLQNIVSTVNMGVKLDLKKIALHARNAEFNPKRFAAVIMRIREPRTTALIFSSGMEVEEEDMSCFMFYFVLRQNGLHWRQV